MKKIVLTIFATIIAFVSIASCGNSTNENESNNARAEFVKDSIAKAEFVKDSIAKAEFVKDSIAKAYDAEIIKTHKALFTENKDEFSDRVWVMPKDAPKYRNRNGVFCYFQLENGVASNFRFVFQYYADNWLFIKNMIFNFDGDKNITIIPKKMDTDSGNGGMIWEWCDEPVSGSLDDYDVNELFILHFVNASNVKVKMNGRQYYDTRTLTSSQIESIKKTYEYYLALGGKFKY